MVHECQRALWGREHPCVVPARCAGEWRCVPHVPDVLHGVRTVSNYSTPGLGIAIRASLGRQSNCKFKSLRQREANRRPPILAPSQLTIATSHIACRVRLSGYRRICSSVANGCDG